MPRSSIGIGTPEKEETVSTIRTTSGYFLATCADLRQRIHDAGGSLAVDEGDGVELAGGEFFIERLGIDMFAPFDLQRLGVFPAALGDVEPFVGERAAHAVEDAARDEIADRASITPQADEVERKTGCFVPNRVWRRGWIAAVELRKASLRWPIIGRVNAAQVLAETSTGPGMKSLSCGIRRQTSNVQRSTSNVECRGARVSQQLMPDKSGRRRKYVSY